MNREDEQGVDDKLKEAEQLLKNCEESMAANEKAAATAVEEAEAALAAEKAAKKQKAEADAAEKKAKTNEANAGMFPLDYPSFGRKFWSNMLYWP